MLYQKVLQLVTVIVFLSSFSLYSRQCLVRVLLAQRKEKNTYVCSSSKGFTLLDRTTLPARKIRVTDTTLTITLKKNSMIINGHQYKRDSLHIIPQNGFISFEDNIYEGIFFIACIKKEWHLINIIPLEKYVCSVLRTESWPGWSLEVNKALAIAIRSYVLAMMHEARLNKKLYHVKNTNTHQTYKGFHEEQVLHQAVEQTKHIFLAHEGMPIVAMFDCCCGGVIPAYIENLNLKNAPYLGRTYPCTYCRPCKIYNWEIHYSHLEFELLLKNFLKKEVGKIIHCTVVERDKAGLVKKVKIKGAKGLFYMTGQEMYSMCKGVKSFHFTMRVTEKGIVVKGRGFGHHRGLCQWGVNEMGRHGRTHREALQYYFPNTVFMCLHSDY